MYPGLPNTKTFNFQNQKNSDEIQWLRINFFLFHLVYFFFLEIYLNSKKSIISIIYSEQTFFCAIFTRLNVCLQ